MRIVDLLCGRRGFALALVLLMAIAGYLKAAIVSEASAEPVGFTLCHGSAAGTSSGDAVNHNCCDDCTIAAAAVAPVPPALFEPLRFSVDRPQIEIADAVPTTGWVWTPRQSQGPPAA
jgi:hypothetical protein